MSELTDPIVSSAAPNEQDKEKQEQDEQQQQQQQLHDESIKNASTEVLVDTTILDRLAALHIIGDNKATTATTSTILADEATPTPTTPPQEVADEPTCSAIATEADDPETTLDHPHQPNEQPQQQTQSEANNCKPNNHSSSPLPTTPTPDTEKSAPSNLEPSSSNEKDGDVPERELNESATPPLTPSKKPEKSAELTRSILAGEVSDTSECSVDVDEDHEDIDRNPNDTTEINVTKVSEADNGKAASSDVSDEEMFIEDQDEEDVEEEEEFHDIEDEKHKTSQEFVDADKSSATPNATSSSSSPVKETKVDFEVAKNPDVEQATTVADEEPRPEQISSETSSDDKITDPQTSIKAEVEQVANGIKPKISDWADIMLSNIKASESDNSLPVDETSAKPVDESEKQAGEAEKKELDLDEDVKNPQYIPKKGVFYEHDDRSHDVEGDKQASASSKKGDENVEAKESPGAKKLPSQDKQNDNRRGNRRQQRADSERWGHDLFRDERQKPKNKTDMNNSYGHEVRHERSSRNQGDNRRGNTNSDRQQGGGQDNQRSRQNRDNRTPRTGQATNSSRERKPRRQNNRGRNDSSLGTPSKRDGQQGVRPTKTEAPETPKTDADVQQQQGFSSSVSQPNFQSARRDNRDGSSRDRNNRNDNRNRRQNSKDRPNVSSTDSKLPPITTVMPPITTWSNKIEDMVKEDAMNRESPARQNNSNSIAPKSREHSEDQWPVSNPNKSHYQDRTARNINDNRNHQQQQQQYNSRGRYQDRDNEPHRQLQFVNRNHYGDRSNQHNRDWGRNNNYSSYAKQNEPIKTQTFENSRLSQSNMNRGPIRDARDIINERRMQSQQGFAPKGLVSADQQLHQQRQLQHTQYLQQLSQQHNHQPPHHHHQQQQMMQHHHHNQQQQQPSNQHIRQQPPTSQQQTQHQMTGSGQSGVGSTQPAQQISNARNSQQPTQTQSSSHQQARQNVVLGGNVAEGVTREPARITNPNVNTTTANELSSSRPIIKTDTYSGAGVQSQTHSQQPPSQQHSQNHRSLGGPLSQQSGPNSATGVAATATMAPVPPHMGPTGAQTQYYPPPNSTRDAMAAAAAAAAASAYHGYMPGGHSVMDHTSRYHMSSQQMSDHGYMGAGPGQANNVAASSVMHQPGMYGDASGAGGTVASSAYMTQPGSTLSPSSSIPVTGAGPPPMAPYLQHSQYAPPPYSNPYSQPQHDHQVPPPQSNQAYPYWTYI